LRQRIDRADRLALFLDYDGTLTPIRKHPDEAVLSLKTTQLLRALARHPKVWVTIVSGRSLDDVKRKVGLKGDGVWYIGNHGLEAEGTGLRFTHPTASKAKPLIDRLAERLNTIVRPIPGAWVEHKGLTLSVHFRQVSPTKKPLVQDAVEVAIHPFQKDGKVRLSSGKEVLEVRPCVRWNKGEAVGWLLSKQKGSLAKGTLLPIGVGDDKTDEDMFRILNPRGITVAVGPDRPNSSAQYRIASVKGVEQFLKRLLHVVERNG
jgi:trehalose 6-phosphate phosphatase